MTSYVLSFVISTSAALFLVYNRASYQPAEVGLVLTYSYLIPYFLLHYSFIFNELLAGFISLERILQYAEVRMYSSLRLQVSGSV